jgi:hypothetical protein
MSLPDKISFRPGTLAGPMAAKLAETSETPSEYLRRLVASDCGVECPEMKEGNPNAAEQAQLANSARWKAKRKRQRKSG